MAVETPSLLDGVSLGSKDFRRMLHAAMGGTPGSFAGGIGATNGAAHGVTTATGLAVVQNGTPNMSVNVAAGLAIITPTSSAALGPFPFYNNATENLSIGAAHASLARRDLVIAEIRIGSTPRLFVVPGTPSGAPVDPSLVLYPDCLIIGRVRVAAAASSITNAAIDDLRTFAGVQAAQQEKSGVFTPNFTNVNGGMGPTLSGRWHRVGPIGIVHVELTLGTGGNFVGTVGVSGLPLAFIGSAIGAAWLFDSSVGTQISGIGIASGAAISQFNSPTGLVAAAAPWTWATADQLRCTVVGLVA